MTPHANQIYEKKKENYLHKKDIKNVLRSAEHMKGDPVLSLFCHLQKRCKPCRGHIDKVTILAFANKLLSASKVFQLQMQLHRVEPDIYLRQGLTIHRNLSVPLTAYLITASRSCLLKLMQERKTKTRSLV